MKHIFPNRLWRGLGRWVSVFLFLFLFLVYIHSSYLLLLYWHKGQHDQPVQPDWVVIRTSFKGQSAKVFLIHLSALCSYSGLSEHATIKKEKAALIQGAIISERSCRSKNMWFTNLCTKIQPRIMFDKSNISFLFQENHLPNCCCANFNDNVTTETV